MNQETCMWGIQLVTVVNVSSENFRKLLVLVKKKGFEFSHLP